MVPLPAESKTPPFCSTGRRLYVVSQRAEGGPLPRAVHPASQMPDMTRAGLVSGALARVLDTSAVRRQRWTRVHWQQWLPTQGSSM